MNDKIFEYQNSGESIIFYLQKTSDGIIFNCYSVFNRDPLESNNYQSEPFSAQNFFEAIKELEKKGETTIKGKIDSLQIIQSNAGFFDIDFHGQGYGNNIFLQKIPIDISTLINKLGSGQN